MGLMKRIGKSEWIRGTLCRLGAAYIRLVWATSRWRVEGGEIPAAFWDQGRPFILAFWHGRLLMMPKCWRADRPIHMLISHHRDGQLIARTVAHFGIHSIAGSTTRGGAAGLRSLLKALKAGECVGITPDGPKGPRMRASDGILGLARLSGCPVIPVSYSARPAARLESWDRFQVPRPFARGVFVWGQPITVPRDADAAALDAIRQHLETAMNADTDRADALAGMDPVAPA